MLLDSVCYCFIFAKRLWGPIFFFFVGSSFVYVVTLHCTSFIERTWKVFFFLLSFSGTSRRELRAGFACETIWTSCEGVPLTSSSAPLWKPVCLGFLSSLESLWINYIPRKGYILSCTWNGAEQSKNPLCLERNMGTEVETLFLCWVVTALGFAGGSRPSHGHQNSWWYSARGRPSKT